MTGTTPHYVILCHTLSATVIVIGFEETRYSVKETESVEVCLTVISGMLDLEEGDDITISCSSSGGTATSSKEHLLCMVKISIRFKICAIPSYI